jgi:hypothetical protein
VEYSHLCSFFLVPEERKKGNLESNEANNLANILGCVVGTFSIKYLGIPLHYEKLRREDVPPEYLIDKILKKIAGWRGKLLSMLPGLF